LGSILGKTEQLESTGIPYTHALVKSLLYWFKIEFFTWVDTLPCQICNNQTKNIGTGQPFENDLLHGASRVELHYCELCNASTRFPRYNDPLKLMTSRKGRCGEWCNAFTLICRCMGLETRYVLDFTDHVWTEIYCNEQKRWIHCDSCENIFDEPLLYEKGWGKRLNYVIGFSDYLIKDITVKYTFNFNNLKRDLITEEEVAICLVDACKGWRLGLSQELITKLYEKELIETFTLLRQMSISGTLDLPVRQSGSVEWRTARGEMGNSKD
jgi:peptide-N4-(N-acetyl-beta-glucosaminyl)asparagine amidase